MEKCRYLLHCLVILGVVALGTNSMDDETRRGSPATVEEDVNFASNHKRLLISSMQQSERSLFSSSTISQLPNETSVNKNEDNSSTAAMALESSGSSVQTPIVTNSEQMRLKRRLKRSRSGHKDPKLKPRDAAVLIRDDLKLESNESLQFVDTNVPLPATRESTETTESTTPRERFPPNETIGTTSGKKLEAKTSSLTLSGSASTESSANWTSSTNEFDLDERSSSLEMMNFSFTSDRSVIQPDNTSGLQNKMGNDIRGSDNYEGSTRASANSSTESEVRPLKVIIPLADPESEEEKSVTTPVNVGSSFYERSISRLTLPRSIDPSVKDCRSGQLTAEEQSTKDTASEQCASEEKRRSSPIYSSEANSDAENDVSSAFGVAVNREKASLLSANSFPELLPIDSVEIVIYESFNDSQYGGPLKEEKDESDGRATSSTFQERANNSSLSQIFPVELVETSQRQKITTEDSLYIMEGLGYFQNDDVSELEADPETPYESLFDFESYQVARKHAMELLGQTDPYAELPREVVAGATLGWNSLIEHDNPFWRDGQARKRNTDVVGGEDPSENDARIPHGFDSITSPRLAAEAVTDDSRPPENHTARDVSRNWLVPIFYVLLALGIVVLGWSVWYGQSSLVRKQEMSRMEDVDRENDPDENGVV